MKIVMLKGEIAARDQVKGGHVGVCSSQTHCHHVGDEVPVGNDNARGQEGAF
jgi:hypothetical protein